MNAKHLGCPDIGAPTATFPQLHWHALRVRHADEVCDGILHHPPQLQPQPITAHCDYFHIAWLPQLFWRDGGVSPSGPHLARLHFAPCTCGGGSYYLQPASQTRLTVGNALHIILTLCSSGPRAAPWFGLMQLLSRFAQTSYVSHTILRAHDLSARTLANKRPGLKYVLICKKQQNQH